MDTWNEAVERFVKVTDRLGKPIDEGIFETVVALNMLGIITRQSCEGHLGWGFPYPWVSIENDEGRFLLHKYLCSYYKARPEKILAFDNVFIISAYRMQPVSAIYFDHLSDDEQALKLKQYQAEMHEFKAFLKSMLESLMEVDEVDDEILT